MWKKEIMAEIFILMTFLNFYNKRNSTNYEIKELSDIKEREEPMYDYLAIDKKSKKKMAIEIKRLIPKEREYGKDIYNWVNDYISKPLQGKIRGTYFLGIRAFNFPLHKKKYKKRIKPLEKIKNEIQSITNLQDYYQLKSCNDMFLFKFSDDGSCIIPAPIYFSKADEREIARILDKALNKFNNTSEEIIKIILLVEFTPEARGDEIAGIIEDLEVGIEPDDFGEKPRNFKIIDGIFHIAVGEEPVIAKVWPKANRFESRLVNFSSEKDKIEFNNWMIIYFS